MRRLAWLVALLAGGAAAVPPPAPAAPVSSHAELYTCCLPQAFKERIFQESAALGATYIRASVEMSTIFTTPDGPPDWRGLDEVIALSRRYHVRVLGILLETPTWLSTCPTAAQPGHCPPRDLGAYGALAGRIAAHARGVIGHWQILNEPWHSERFTGTPEDYGRLLSVSNDSIKRAAPEDLVVIGNTYVSVFDRAWSRRVFATAGARRKYDIGAVDLRRGLSYVAGGLRAWRRFLAGEGFRGPVWVTEHGYPADQVFQDDPSLADGDAAQARYLRRSLRDLDAAGAAEVFVTLRHRSSDMWVSEGIIDFGDPPTYPAIRKPAFYTVRSWAAEWTRRQARYRERVRWYRGQISFHRAVAERSERRVETLRTKAAASRRRERRYRRRARKLEAAAKRYGLCFEQRGTEVCGRRAARAWAGAARAERRATAARRKRRRYRRAAMRPARVAEMHRRDLTVSAV